MSTEKDARDSAGYERVIALLRTEFAEQTRGRTLDAATALGDGLALSSLDMLALVAHVELLVGDAPLPEDLGTIGSLARFLDARGVPAKADV